MSTNQVINPYEYFMDFNQGRPIFNGQIFVGLVGTDPEVQENQKDVTFSDACDCPEETVIMQPIRTSSGGVPIYNGSPIRLFVEGAYSLKVNDRNGVQVYYSPDVTKGVPLTPDNIGALMDEIPTNSLLRTDNLAALRLINPAQDNQIIFVVSHTKDGIGGGEFYYDSSDTSSQDNNGTVVISANGSRWIRSNQSSISICDFGAISDFGTGNTDNMEAIQGALDNSKNVTVPAGSFGFGGPISVGTARFTGDGQQNSKLFCTDSSDGVKLKITSGTILDGIKLFGPWSASTDVGINNIGVSDLSGVDPYFGGSANRAIIRDFRVESFGINYSFYKTQNFSMFGSMSQYAKYKEFYLYKTENTFIYSCNSNGRGGLPLPASDASYKWIHADAARNLRIWGGIHERSETIVSPALFENGTGALIEGVEFNAASESIVSVINSSITMISPAFTMSGLEENTVSQTGTGVVFMQSPVHTGTNGKHYYSLCSGNVRYIDSDGNFTFFNTPLSQFRNSSGGLGDSSGGFLEVVGASGAQGVEIDDKTSNNSYIIGDSKEGRSYNLVINVASVSGCSNINVFIARDFSSTGQYRRNLAVITAETGSHSIPVILEEGDSPSSIGIGVVWDGITVDPVYGDKGVIGITSRRATLNR